MNSTRSSKTDLINIQVKEIWNRNADFWDEKMAEGNQFHRLLVAPAVERLLEPKAGESVLEIACGNGAFSRQLARLGLRVTATDFAEKLLERARVRSKEFNDQIEYRLIDATDEGELLSLGTKRFDAAVCNMALMDMAEIKPLFTALTKLLKRNGRFVFSIMHPCFNMSTSILMAEEEDRSGELVTTYSVKVDKYLSNGTAKGLAMVGQPVPQFYFNRPLHVLLNTCFDAGFIMDRIEEPAFDETVQPSRPLSWLSFREIPPVLAVRLKLPS